MRSESGALVTELRIPTRWERIVDGWVHVVGLVAAVSGAVVIVWMTADRGSGAAVASVSIYALGLLAMLGCSAAYNLSPPSPRREFLRRFDHAAIFVMIAGSYTPWTTLSLEGAWAISMTAVIWAIAAIGAGIKIFLPRRFETLSVVVYLAMGWIVVIAFGPLIDVLPTTALVLLIVGGGLYSAGVAFHLWNSLPYQNAIWHGFVIAAATVHYIAIMNGVVLFDGAA